MESYENCSPKKGEAKTESEDKTVPGSRPHASRKNMKLRIFGLEPFTVSL